jgi:hypothetical protein
MNEYDEILRNENEYDSSLKRESDVQGIRASTVRAIQSNPESVAQARKLSTKTGIPLEVVERNLDEVSKKQKLNEYDLLVEGSPYLAERLKDVEFAKIAHDDTESLKDMEARIREFGEWKEPYRPTPGVFSWLSGVAISFREGAKQTKKSMQLEMQDVGIPGIQEDPAKTEVRRQDTIRKYLQSRGIEEMAKPEFESETVEAIYGGTVSFARTAPGLAASIATRSPVPMLGLMGLEAQSQAYGKYRARGATPGEAALGSVGEGATEVATELLPMGFLVKNLGKLGAGKFLTGLLAREIPSEQVATLVQDAIDTAVANPEKTWGEYLAERPGAVYSTLISTITQTVLTGGINAAALAVSKDESERPKINKTFIEKINDLAANSKLRQRDPESFAKYVEGMVEGTPAESVMIPVERWTAYWQSVNTDPAIIAESIIGKTAYREAITAGTDIVIPMSRYATQLASTEHGKALLPDIRFNSDELTQREAEEIEKELVKESGINADTETDRVREDIVGQLISTGTDRSTAEAYASIHSAVSRVLGQAGGERAQKLLEQRYGDLRIVRPLPDVLEKHAKTDALDVFLDRLRSGDVPTDKDVYGESLLDFIVKQGGLKDQGRELSARDMQKVRVGLVNDKGRTLDDIAELAVEHGYLSERDPNLLLEAISKEMMGKKVYRQGKQDADLLNVRAAIEQLDDHLRTLGVNVKEMDNAAIKKMLQSDPEKGKELFQGSLKDYLFQSEKPIWFSALEKGIESAKQAKATAKDWKAIIPKLAGVKADEIEATGLNEWLDMQTGQVTKESVLEFVRQNGVQVQEMTLGDNQAERDALAEALHRAERRRDIAEIDLNYVHENLSQLDSANLSHWAYEAATGDASAERKIDLLKLGSARKAVDAYGKAMAEWHEIREKLDTIQNTKFASYQLPGGENYRELLLTLPETSSDKQKYIDADNAFRAYQEELRQKYGSDEIILRKATPEEARRLDELGKPIRDIKSKQNKGFRSSHFDEPNILAHVRFNERTDAEGKRVLFIEEVQSDLAQKGRKEGFKEGENFKPHVYSPEEFDVTQTDAQWVTRDKLGHERVVGKGVVDGDKGAREYFARWLTGLEKEMAKNDGIVRSSQVPSAPFVTKTEAWTMLAMKRMIRYASENGFDRIAWTTGEQQAARYDLSKQVEAITWQKQGDRYQIFVYPKTGNQIEKNLAPSEIQDFVGKEVSDKITGSGKDTGVLRGLDLKVGGEGMKAFYDQMLPQVVNKYVKKWGAKVGETVLSKFTGTKSPDDMSDGELLGALDEPAKGYGVHSLDITQAMSDAVMQGQPLFQKKKDIKRGAIRFGQDRKFTIELFQKADLSTFLHESGHFFLELFGDVYSDLKTIEEDKLTQDQRRVIDDFDAALKWLGVESREQIKTEHHEKWAKGFEAYLLEGKSPSTELRGVFAKFRAWLVYLYRSVKLDVRMNDQIRGVMDRLLATEEEIENANRENEIIPVFTDPADVGMSDAEFSAYRRIVEEANKKAKERLQQKLMNEIRRGQEAWWKDERDKIKSEVLEELNKQHGYIAEAILKNGKMPDGSDLPDGMPPMKLDSKSVHDRNGKDFIKRLPKGIMAKEGGVDPDVAADILGFESGDKLLLELAGLRPKKALAEAETDKRMEERYGSMLLDGTIQAEATEAVLSDHRYKVIDAEIKALRKRVREVKPYVKAEQNKQRDERRRGLAMLTVPMASQSVVKQMADGVIAQKRIRDIRPDGYLMAIRRAAKEAVKLAGKGDYQGALMEKQRELLNLELYRSANDALDRIEKGKEYLSKFDKKSVRDKMRGEAVNQIDDLLSRFDLRRRSLKAIDAERETLEQFVKNESDRLAAVTPDLPGFIKNETYRKNYKDLSVDEMTGLVDSVKQLERLARREQEQYLAIRQMNFEQERGTVLDRIRQFHPEAFEQVNGVWVAKKQAPDRIPTISKAAETLGDKGAGEFLNSETILNLLEGGDYGDVERSLFGRMSDRSNWKATKLAEIYKKLKPLFKAYGLAERRQFARKDIGTDIGIPVTRENAVVVALLYGNKEGRERLMNYGWSAAQIKQIIALLDEKDLRLVDGIWKLFDEDLWPELKDLNERTRGKAPPKVEPISYQTKHGPARGGYFRLKYDTDLSERAHHFDESQAVQAILGGSLGMTAKTNQGTSEQRQEGVKLLPRLDLGVFSETVNETVHDLAYREAVADTMRMLNDKEVQNAIKTAAGIPAYRTLVTRVREVAAPPRNPTGFIEKTLSIARKNTIVTLLSGARTALLNITGVASVYARSFEKESPVSAALLTRELGKFFSWRMNEMYEFATSHSEYMRHRFNNYDRDLQDMARKLTVNGKILPDTYQFLWLMGMTDRAVTVPIWNASFAEGMKRYKNDPKQAVEYADHIVRQTQGSGRDVDLPKIMSGHGGYGQLKKVFTMFQSYSNAQLGQLIRAKAISAKEAKENRTMAVSKFTARFMLLMVIPTALSTIGGREDDDLDDEDWFKKLVYSMVMYGAAMIPIVRDLSAYAWSLFDKDIANYGLKISPVQSAGEGLGKGAVSLVDIVSGEGDKKDTKNLIMGISYAVGLPGKQISDTVLGAEAFLQGEAGPEAVVFGPD